MAFEQEQAVSAILHSADLQGVKQQDSGNSEPSSARACSPDINMEGNFQKGIERGQSPCRPFSDWGDGSDDTPRSETSWRVPSAPWPRPWRLAWALAHADLSSWIPNSC